MEEFSIVGKRVPRLEGPSKATGSERYTTDLFLPNMLFGKVLRSPHPHARILNIDTKEAERLPGVKAVITSKDMPNVKYGGYVKDETPLAGDKVRYVGDALAAVAAVDESIAERAIDLIRVDYEVLPAVFDPEEAMKPGAPLIYEAERNVASYNKFEVGDIVKGFSESDFVREDRFETQQVTHCVLEPHVCVAVFDKDGLTVWPRSQQPFGYRRIVSSVMGIPLNKVRVISLRQGGGFGGKVEVLPLDLSCIMLSKLTRRPVKIVNSREEEFTTTRTRHPYIVYMKTGVKKDGTLVAREARVIVDNGAYSSRGPGVVKYAAWAFASLYRIPNIKVESFVVYTNKQAGGAFRGWGNPQIHFPGESQIDMIAETMGLDPMEIRLKNATRLGDVTSAGWIIKSCGLSECIQKAADKIGWKQKRQNKRPNVGIGMACLIHITSMRYHPSLDADFSSASVKVQDDGSVTVMIANSDMGQGMETVMAQIAAEELGVRLEDVQIISGDTSTTPECMGGWGSRLTFMCGNAVKMAAAEAKNKLLEAAGDKFDVPIHDLSIKGGKVYVRGPSDREVPISEIVSYSLNRKGSQAIYGYAHFDADDVNPDRITGIGNISAAYPFACQIAEVEVDPETGQVKVLKIVSAHDIGKTINPMAAEGQIDGAAAQGIGYALFEDLLLKNGKVVNSNFLDYKIPLSTDMPKVEHIFVETNDPAGPFGAKGLGEPVIIGVAPAIANAICDATGIRIKKLPITQEKLYAALKEKRK